MDAARAFTIAYTLLVTLFNVVLFTMNETSPDVYISLNILSYYMAYLVFLRGERHTLAQRAVNTLFIIILILIIIYRIYKVT